MGVQLGYLTARVRPSARSLNSTGKGGHHPVCYGNREPKELELQVGWNAWYKELGCKFARITVVCHIFMHMVNNESQI